MGDESRQLDEVTRMLARLAHRFADREAILWRAGLDEARWTAMEAELVEQLISPSTSDRELIQFARSYLEARAELIRGVIAPISTAVTTRHPTSEPHSSDEAAVTLPRGTPSANFEERFRSTAVLGTPAKISSQTLETTAVSRAPILDDPLTEDDPLSATLYSDGRGRRMPPRSQ